MTEPKGAGGASGGAGDAPVYGMAVGAYLAAGWPSVLPLPPGKKSPPPGGCTGSSGVDPSPEQMEAWAEAFPDANVGLRCPATVIGIDVDHYGAKHGADELEVFAAEHGLPPLPETWVSTARWSAKHGARSGIRWYRVASRKLRPEVCPAVDVIQRGHRYAVVWPSMHPSGGRYVWVGPGGEVAEAGTVPAVSDLPVLDARWLEALAVGRGGGGGGEKVATAGASGVGAGVERVTRAEAMAWLAEADRAFGPWSWSVDKVVERMLSRARAGQTRHSAQLWATALVVGDVAKADLPGAAVLRLEQACQRMYEEPSAEDVGLPAKDAKGWKPAKHEDFWSGVEGAIAKYSSDGAWASRVAGLEAVGRAAVDKAMSTRWLDDERLDEAKAVDKVIAEAEKAAATVGTWTGSEVLEAAVDDMVQEERDRAYDSVVDAGGTVAEAREAEREARIRATARAEAMAEWFNDMIVDQADRMQEMDHWSYVATALLDEMGLAQRVERPGGLTAGDLARVVEQARTAVEDMARIATGAELGVGAAGADDWVEDWLPRSAIVPLVAAPAVGKSTLAVDLGLRVAAGVPWLDGVWVRQGPVLYLAHEAHAVAARRVAAWCQDRGLDRVPERFSLAAPRAGLSTAEGRAVVRRWLGARWERGEGGLVVVDTLAAGFVGDENETAAMSEFVRGCLELIDERPGTTVLVVHHPTKDVKRSEFASSGRGSGVLTAAADTELAARRLDTAETLAAGGARLVELCRQKSRSGTTEGTLVGALRVIDLVGERGERLVKGSGARLQEVVVADATEGDLEVLRAAETARAAEKLGKRDLEAAAAAGWLADEVWRRVDELERLGVTVTARTVYRGSTRSKTAPEKFSRLTWRGMGRGGATRVLEPIDEDDVARVLEAGRDGPPSVGWVRPKAPELPILAPGYRPVGGPVGGPVGDGEGVGGEP